MIALPINKTKTMLIRSSRKKNVPSLSVHLHGSQISWSLLKQHTYVVSVKVGQNIVLLRHLSWFLLQSALLLFYKSLSLERLQMYAAKIILRLSKDSSATSARKCWVCQPYPHAGSTT